jgi:seryl-tRNA synthetase
MIDLKYIRTHPQEVRNAILNKNEKANLDAILELDENRRKLQYEYDQLRSKQHQVSQIIVLKKRNGEDVSELLEEMSKVAEQIKTLNAQLTETNTQLESLLLTIPNIPHPDVPIGKDESANKVIKMWGEKPGFAFTALDHVELAEKNRLLDLPRGAKISGSGFPIYTGIGANTELAVPVLVTRKTMTGTGQLPKLEDDMYRIEADDLFLIPTAEVPVTNFFADEILPQDKLPLKFVSYTPCFRREAGSYGKETKGLQRLHQFNKVELVRFVEPSTSYQALEEIREDAEEILQALNLHYRVVELCTADLSFASAKTYDIEVWAPGLGKYLEVSSISNFEDFQARRANIRYRDTQGKLGYLHTLNGSGVATHRLMIA